MKKGLSPQTVASNVKEQMRDGKSRVDSISAALSLARKYKAMSPEDFVEGEEDNGEEIKLTPEEEAALVAAPVEPAPVINETTPQTALSDLAREALERAKKSRRY